MTDSIGHFIYRLENELEDLSEGIQVKSTAVIKGNLTAPRIQLDDGGKFRGSMVMTDTDQENKTV
ncbi:MAG: cytoskeletal protein CcmA (bactofilin family) [Polaribacter sp.]|jgi:cytoskeletal protein CcmA (bactofilin family)